MPGVHTTIARTETSAINMPRSSHENLLQAMLRELPVTPAPASTAQACSWSSHDDDGTPLEYAVTIEDAETIGPFVALMCAEEGRRARLIREIILKVPFLAQSDAYAFLPLLPQLTQLTTLCVLHAEQLFTLCPPSMTHITLLTSLQELKLERAAVLAYCVAQQMCARLVSLEVHGLPGFFTEWRLPALTPLWWTASLRRISMPNIFLDLRARSFRCPRVEFAHFAYDRLDDSDVELYMFTFPKLQEFWLPQTSASPASADRKPSLLHNMSSGTQGDRWADLERVFASPKNLWLLGLHMPVKQLSLPIPCACPAEHMRFAVTALNPEYLSMLFQSPEDARSTISDFAELLAPWRVSRLVTLFLDLPLPLDIGRFTSLLRTLLANVSELHCERLIVRFAEPILTDPERPARPQAAYTMQTRWDEMTAMLLGAGTRLKQVQVVVSSVHGPSSRPAVYTANAASA